jgi:hypothetical protein
VIRFTSTLLNVIVPVASAVCVTLDEAGSPLTFTWVWVSVTVGRTPPTSIGCPDVLSTRAVTVPSSMSEGANPVKGVFGSTRPVSVAELVGAMT